MPPSLSTLERGNPPSRRKSCTACTRAKRRCDNTRPACLRCARRGLSCVYDAVASAADRPQQPTQDLFSSLSPSPQPLLPQADPIMGELDLLWPDHTTRLSDFQPVSEAPLEEPSGGVEMLDFLLEPPAGSGLGDLGAMAEPESFELIGRGGPWNLFPPRLPGAGRLQNIIFARLQYGMDAIKQAPWQMILENRTPWCHGSLYRDSMPRSMQDAHACCALYIAKNRVNAPVILRSIESRLTDLLAAPEPTTPAEHLARTQALLLYHIMRVLDGDFSARAAAETTMPALEAAATALLEYITWDEPQAETTPAVLPLYPLTAAREFWSSWAFMESARRTFLIAFFFAQLFRFLSGRSPLHCEGRFYLCHSWTMSAHLWQAEDAFDFALAWRDNRRFVITRSNLQKALDEARPDDVDQFDKILLTSMMGIDETKGWLASRGGNL